MSAARRSTSSSSPAVVKSASRAAVAMKICSRSLTWVVGARREQTPAKDSCRMATPADVAAIIMAPATPVDMAATIVAGLSETERRRLLALASRDRAGFTEALKANGVTKIGVRLKIEVLLKEDAGPHHGFDTRCP
eukprot:908191-Prymnesium_polylepis.1